ncbi:unnamed protein product [Cochlearia groenlandica]
MASSSSSSLCPIPSFRAIQSFVDTDADYPGPRCGHTLTAINNRLILFGGFTTAERVGSSPAITDATNSVHCYDVSTNKWKRVSPDGVPPTPRAFHAAVSIGDKVLIQGGIGQFGPSTGDLYILQTAGDTFKWNRLEVQGVSPGPRYGHVMGLAHRWIVIFGGKIGDITLADTWALDPTLLPYMWRRLNPFGNLPSARMYACASTREDGIFVLCGGRDFSGVSLGDAYWLIMRGNGQWFWTLFPNLSPSPRYQHTTVFRGSCLHVNGGVLSGTHLIDAEAAVGVLDTSTGVWSYRNGPWISKGRINELYHNQLMQRCRHAAALVGSRIYVYGGQREGVLLNDFLVSEDAISQPSSSEPRNSFFMSSSESLSERFAELHVSLPSVEDAFYACSDEYSYTPQFTGQTSTRVLLGKVWLFLIHFHLWVLTMFLLQVISTLLRPLNWIPPVKRNFFLSNQEVDELCKVAEHIIMEEPTLLQLSHPVKVFGDLHGQFGDLMRLFKEYGEPSSAGDISSIDYLFLGDYVDRGKHSLETIILLLALKIEYPKNIHLIRGNHESSSTNTVYGFRQECMERMDDGFETWTRINQVFDHLPLAALIGKKILCMHGGLGSTLRYLDQIQSIQRPIALGHVQAPRVVKDILWSDPTENDSILGVTGNSRGPDVSSFGPDIVKEFCERNKIDMIIRAHECVLDGIERFAGGKLITVFSATNYCGVSKNAGAILIIGRDWVVYTKMIHPIPPPISPSEISEVKTWSEELNEDYPPTPVRGKSNSFFGEGSSSESN